MPPPLDPPREEDLSAAAAGDKRAYLRVKKQESRVRAREKERAAWIAERKATLAAAAGNARADSDVGFSAVPSAAPSPLVPSSAASSRAHSPRRTAPSPPPAPSPPSSRHSSPFR